MAPLQQVKAQVQAQAPVAAKPPRQTSTRGRGAKATAASTRKPSARASAQQPKGPASGYASDDLSGSDSGSSSSGGDGSSSGSESDSEESDLEFKGKTPPPAKKAVGRKKKVVKPGGNASHWAVPYEPVLVPMGSRTLEKILAWRMHEGKEELLIKYKVSLRGFLLKVGALDVAAYGKEHLD